MAQGSSKCLMDVVVNGRRTDVFSLFRRASTVDRTFGRCLIETLMADAE